MKKEVKKSAKETKKEVPRKISKVQKPAPNGKCARLRTLLTSGKKIFSVEELMKISGFDQNNVRVAMNILRNKNRTKETIESVYDKEKKNYSLK